MTSGYDQQRKYNQLLKNLKKKALMKNRIKNWWYWNNDIIGRIIIVIISFVLIFSSIVSGLVWLQGNTYKYNCNLDHRVDWYTTLMINDDSYAYNPEGFCDYLKEQVAKRK